MPSPGEDVKIWSKTALDNATIDPLINWQEGMPRADVNNSARSTFAAVAKWRDLLNGSIVTTGTANAQAFISGVGYTGTVPTGINARLKIGATLTNTGPVTLNMDGIGDAVVLTMLGAELGGNELKAGAYADFLFDGTNWILLQQRPDLTGSVTIINNVTVINQNTTEFVIGIDDKYDEYEIRFAGVQAETDNVELWLEVSEDEGLTWKTAAGAYDWCFNATLDSGGGNVVLDASVLSATNHLVIERVVSALPNRSIAGSVKFYKPASTTLNKMFMWDVAAVSVTNLIRFTGAGVYLGTTNAINGVRFKLSSGQIKAGNFVMIGSMKTSIV